MSHKRDFSYDETSGICSCIIRLSDLLLGFGIAQCAEQDKDIMSERTGQHIAEIRAQISLLQNFKNHVLRPGLDALVHLRSTMIQSPKFNPESYEAKRLEAEIKNHHKDIAEINDAIEGVKAGLYDYINMHEEIAQKIRQKQISGYKEEDSERIVNMINFYDKVIKNDDQT